MILQNKLNNMANGQNEVGPLLDQNNQGTTFLEPVDDQSLDKTEENYKPLISGSPLLVPQEDEENIEEKSEKKPEVKALRYIQFKDQVVYEDDYLKNYAGKPSNDSEYNPRPYPKDFDEYANQLGKKIFTEETENEVVISKPKKELSFDEDLVNTYAFSNDVGSLNEESYEKYTSEINKVVKDYGSRYPTMKFEKGLGLNNILYVTAENGNKAIFIPKGQQDRGQIDIFDRTKTQFPFTVENINNFISENRDAEANDKKHNFEEILTGIAESYYRDQNYKRLIPDLDNILFDPMYDPERDRWDFNVSELNPGNAIFQSWGVFNPREYQDITSFKKYIDKHDPDYSKFRAVVKEGFKNSFSKISQYNLDIESMGRAFGPNFIEKYKKRINNGLDPSLLEDDYFLDNFLDKFIQDKIFLEETKEKKKRLKNYFKEVDLNFDGDTDEASQYFRNYALSNMSGEQKEVASAWATATRLWYQMRNMADQGNFPIESFNVLNDQVDKALKYAENLTKEYKNQPNLRFLVDFTNNTTMSGVIEPKRGQGDITTEVKERIKEFNLKKSGSFADLEEGFNIHMMAFIDIEERLDQVAYKSITFPAGEEIFSENRYSNQKYVLGKTGYKPVKNEDGSYTYKDITVRDALLLYEFRSGQLNPFKAESETPEVGGFLTSGFAQSPEMFDGLDIEVYPTDKKYLTNEDFFALKEQIKDLAIDRSAYNEIYMMNINPNSLMRQGEVFQDTEGKPVQELVNIVGRTLSSFNEAVVDDFFGEEVMGQSKSETLSVIQKITGPEGDIGIDQATGAVRGINWDEETINNFKQTTSELVGSTLGYVPKIALEFAALNYATGGAMNVLGATRYLNTLRNGRIFDKTTKAYLTANQTRNLTTIAARQGYKGRKSFEKFLLLPSQVNKYAKHGGGFWQRSQALAWTSFVEEFKMQQFFDMKAGGGTTFAVVGTKFNNVSRALGLQFTGRLNHLNSALKVSRGSASFMVSAEAAPNIEAVIDDLMGKKSWQKHLEEFYTEASGDEIWERQITNLVTGLGFTAQNVKKADFYFSNKSKLKLAERYEKLIAEERKKPESEQNQNKIEKYESIAGEARRQYSYSERVYAETTPSLSKKRAEKEIKKYNISDTNIKVQLDGTGKNKGEYNLENSPAKVFEKGEMLPDGTKAEKNTIIVDGTQYFSGMIPHEAGHIMGKKVGFTESMYESIYKKIETRVEAVLKDFIREFEGVNDKGEVIKEKGSFKNFRELIDFEYRKEDPNRRAEERIMNIIEFLTNKAPSSSNAMGLLIKNNVFYDLKQDLTSFYERLFEKDPNLKGKKISITGPDQIMDLLYRIGSSTGKKGNYKQWNKLRQLVFHDNLIINEKTQIIEGVKDGASTHAITKYINEVDSKVGFNKDLKILDNKYIENKDLWSKNIDPERKVTITQDMSFGLFEYLQKKSRNLKLSSNREKNEAEITDLVLEFLSEKPISPQLNNNIGPGGKIIPKGRGLNQLIFDFNPGKLINSETNKPYESVAAYLNSKVRRAGGRSLIDVRFQEFYEAHPDYGRIIKSFGEKGVTLKAEKSLYKNIEADRSSESVEMMKKNPLNLPGFPRKALETVVGNNFSKIISDPKLLNLRDVPSVYPEATAQYFNIPVKNLKNFLEGKTPYIYDLTAARKIKDRMVVPSEINNVQKVINRDASRILKMLNEYNVFTEGEGVKSEMDVTVSRDLVGTSIGFKGRLQSKMYEPFIDPSGVITSPSGRSKGKTSQVKVVRLKSDYNTKNPDAVNNFKKLLGITKDGYIYDKNTHGAEINTLIKLIDKTTHAKAVEQYLKPLNEQFKQEVVDITAGFGPGVSTKAITRRLEKYFADNPIPSKANLDKLFEESIFKNEIGQELYSKVSKIRREIFSKENRELIDSVKISEIAEQTGQSVTEVRKNLIKEESQYKAAYPEIAKNLNLGELKYRASNEILQSKYYTEKFAKFQGELLKNFYYEGMPAQITKALLANTGKGVDKVLGPDGISRLSVEKYLGPEFRNKDFEKLTTQQRSDYLKKAYNFVPSSKENVTKILDPKTGIDLSPYIYQPSFSAAGKKKIEKIIDQYQKSKKTKNDEQIANDAIIEVVTGGKGSFENYKKANRQMLIESYNHLFLEYNKAPESKRKEVTELILENLRVQTNHALSVYKGLVPIEFSTLKKEPGKDPTKKDKVLYFEHARELFNANSVDFINILKNYKNKPKAAREAVVKMVDGLMQGVTTKKQQELKDKKGPSKSDALDPIQNTFLSKGQNETSIFLGKTPRRPSDVVFEKYGNEIIKRYIKEIGVENLSSEGIKVNIKVNNKSSYDKVDAKNTKTAEALGVSTKGLSRFEIIERIENIDKAINVARDRKAPKKGISVLDFDDTVVKSKSNVKYTLPNGTKGKINATEFAKRSEILEKQGAKFDFSEFNKVIDGQPGPLINKLRKAVNKFGNENVFILTARPQQSAAAIQSFLKGLGINLKIDNITGLSDGRPIAKAQWMVNKAALGYNDFYFADDAIKNTKAVKKVLDIIDVKSDVQLARSTKAISKHFNGIIEYSTGIGKDKTYSTAKARLQGKGGSGTGWYVPSTAEDFAGLMRPLYGKGKKGIQNESWFKENLFKPFARGEKAVAADRMARMEDYKALKNQLKDVGSGYKNLFKEHPLRERISKNEPFTNSHAVRVYLWSKQNTLPKDISKTDVKKLVKHVNSNPKLKAFADQLVTIGKGDGYPAPKTNWLIGNITTDMLTGFKSVKRSKYMKEFNDNVELIFSEQNLNKLEAKFGLNYRESLEGMLYRMKNGSNRSANLTKAENGFLDWLNGSVGATMFLNTRSALLQTISATNYINFTDNNPFKASKAFMNQKQFWNDYMTLMNSKWATNRRNGLRLNVSESEIIEAAANSTNKAAAVINNILSKGFIFTKYADTHATAFGGATFYRNRINTYKRKGFSEAEAKEKARKEWEELSEENQQSARADKISQEQASILGRFTLNYNNVVMQYARNMKKEVLDLSNGRYEGITKGNNSIVAKVGRILYYGAIQNVVFQTLQNAVFMQFFDEGLEFDDNTLRATNGFADALMKGSGIYGAGLSTIKNVLLKVSQESGKKRPQYVEAAWQVLTFSPPLDKKVRQFRNTLRSYQYDLDEMQDKGFSLDNPAYLANANLIEAGTNVPVARVIKKLDNIRGAIEQDRTAWQRVFLLAGYANYQLGIEDDDGSYNTKTYKFKSKPKFKSKSKFNKEKF